MSEQIAKGLTVLSVAIVISALVLSFAVMSAAGSVKDGLGSIKLAEPAVVPTAAPAVATPVAPTAAPTQEPTPGPLDLSKAPMEGKADAKVTIIEFSDFQCPFCKRAFTNTYPTIKKDYIDTGKVKYYFMHFPLDSIHPNARPASRAAICAQEQGKFWEMHDKLFETADLGDASLKDIAKNLGLDTAKFNACFADTAKTDALINEDMAQGSGQGVQGTPGFIILGPNGARDFIAGAYPAERFAQGIDPMLQ